VANAPRDFLYPWLPAFTFDLEKLSRAAQEQVLQLAAVEACFERSNDWFNRFVRFLLGESDRLSLEYVIALEHKSRVRSRVRSYKGIFKDRSGVSHADRASFALRGDLDCLSIELDVGGEYTHLVGLLRPTANNVSDCLDWLRDSTRSFVVSSNSASLSPDELARAVVNAVPGLPGPAYVNYAALTAWLCPRGFRILRMAGQSNDDSQTLQGFTRIEDIALLETTFRAALAATDIA
jgi:hypothetical protein